jgi:GR25 family glycosyltransferase involved in LPS biosynthesis
MNLKNFKTLFINLNQSTDRLNFITEQLNKTKLSYERIKAIDGLLMEDKQKYLSRKLFKCMSNIEENIYRRVGLFRSQLKALKYAIDNHYNGVIILEDDVELLSDFDVDVDIPDDCYILYLNGGMWTTKGKETFDKSKLKPNSVIKIKDFKLVGSYAYIIPSLDKIKEVYDILVFNKMTTYDIALINYIQSKGTCYLYTNKLVQHRYDFDSTITKSWKTSYKIKSIL